MDRLAHRPNAPSEFEERAFYGRVLNIYEFELPVALDLRRPRPETFVLACIRPCAISKGPIPHTSSYLPVPHDNGTPEVVDITTILGLVGRFEYGGRVYIIDRGDGTSIQRAMIEDE